MHNDTCKYIYSQNNILERLSTQSALLAREYMPHCVDVIMVKLNGPNMG